MRYLQTYLVLGLLTAASLTGCTITTSDGSGFGGDNWGGESGDSVGGSSAKTSSSKGGTSTSGGASTAAGGSAASSGGSSAQGGSSASSSSTPGYTKEQCATDAAAAKDSDPCAECLYSKQCDAAVACENKQGCMDSVWAALTCMANTSAWRAAILDEDPSTGRPTADDTDNCTSGALNSDNLAANYPDWNTFEAQGISTTAQDWLGAELDADAFNLWSGLGDTSDQLGCRTVCRLDEVTQ